MTQYNKFCKLRGIKEIRQLNGCRCYCLFSGWAEMELYKSLSCLLILAYLYSFSLERPWGVYLLFVRPHTVESMDARYTRKEYDLFPLIFYPIFRSLVA